MKDLDLRQFAMVLEKDDIKEFGLARDRVCFLDGFELLF